MQADSVRFCDQCGTANRGVGSLCSGCGNLLVKRRFNIRTEKTRLAITRTVLKQRYQIVRKLGQGGFGAVHLAEDIMLDGALRAIKEMSMQGTGSQPIDPLGLKQAVAAFKQEAVLLAKLMHHNLPRISDYFEEHGCWYLVMDYIEGENLENVLEKSPGRRLALPLVLQLADQLCTVLTYLHSRQPPIIFRDIKPTNIMLGEHDHLYLIDFGIARLFKPGQSQDTVALGSPGYAAPEQYGRGQSTPQTDIYSLGVTLHEMLSGHHPNNTPFQFAPLLLDQYAAGPGIADLIQRMVAIAQEKRPGSMQEVKLQIERLSQFSGQTTSSNPTAIILHLPLASAKAVTARIPVVIVAPVGGDYSTLQEAIRHVVPGTRIVVRPGVYNEEIILDKQVEIVGDGPQEQIVLTCEQASCLSMQTENALVSGVTICGQADGYFAVDIPQGRLHLSNCRVTSVTETCIGIYNSVADPLIRQCTICDSHKGGIIVHTQGRGTIEDCEIYANEFAGLAIKSGGRPVVRRCKIYDGLASGIYVDEQGEGMIEDCEIYANKFAGLGITTGGHPLVRGCKIYNGLSNGIYVYEQGGGLIEDCLVYANKAAGVGIKSRGRPVMRNCKIYNGLASGIYVYAQGEGVIEDCLVYANELSGVMIKTGGRPMVRRCKIYDGRGSGIYVAERGGGVLENCVTFRNKISGLAVENGAKAAINNCKFEDGKKVL